MEKSESIKELAAALAIAQGKIENASKNANNPHFKSKYADLAEVINTIRPVFAEHGLAVLQFPSYEASTASVETIITHKSGEWISGKASAPVSKLDAQGVGSAITYLRRYSLSAVAGIAQEDDDGNAASQPAKRAESRIPQTDIPPAMSDAEYQALCAKYADSIAAIRDGIRDNMLSTAAEAWFELSTEVKTQLWKAPSKGGCFTTQEREVIRSDAFKQAHYGDAK